MASSCTTCGSRKLTSAVSSLNLRPLLWIVVFLIGWLAVPLASLLLQTVMSAVFRFMVARILPTLVVLFLLSWALGHILGKKVAKIIHELWEELVKLGFKIMKSLIRSAVKSVDHNEKGKRLHARRHD